MITRRHRGRLAVTSLLILVLCALWGVCLRVELSSAAPQAATKSGFANWGSDHVDSPVPEYVTGDECLFCHRDKFGADWAKNAHQRTLRAVDAASPEMAALNEAPQTKPFAKEIEFVLGERRQMRYVKKTGEYGKAALLSARFTPPHGARSRRARGTLAPTSDVHWDDRTFAQSCAGCHATAVDPKTHAFSATSLDCFSCHGVVDLNHSGNTKLVLFGTGRNDSPEVVVSTCGQCHLRTGKSRSTGLPYPTNFVAGDNLFRDFQVRLSDADLAAMDPGDRHAVQTVRDVLEGKSRTTCLNCHDIHHQSTVKHRQVAEGASCAVCHEPGKPKSERKRYEAHNALCGY